MELNGQTRLATCVVAIWAFAEATLFFVIPDVALTWFASRKNASPRRLVLLVSVATAAAIVGGMTVFAAARLAPSATRDVVVAVPAISASVFEAAEARVIDEGISSLATASSRGEPYKIYAAAAGRNGIGFGQFVLWSIPGRLPRFAVVSLVAFAIGRVLPTQTWINLLYAAVWTAVYATYWSKFPL